MIVGTAIIYLPGLLAYQLIGFGKAVQFGLVPFIYGDILKLVIAAVSVPLMCC